MFEIEPLLPVLRLIGPLAHLDAPIWWLRWKKKRAALLLSQAAADGCLGGCHQFLGAREGLPYPCGFVLRGGHDALAVGTKRSALYRCLMADEHGDRADGLRVPYPRTLVL